MNFGIIHGSNTPIKKIVKPITIVAPQATPTIDPCSTNPNEANKNSHLLSTTSKDTLSVEKMVKIKDNQTGQIIYVPQSQLGQYNVVDGLHTNNSNQNSNKKSYILPCKEPTPSLTCGEMKASGEYSPAILWSYGCVSATPSQEAYPTPTPTDIPTPTPTPTPVGLQGQVNCNPNYVGGYDCSDSYGNQATLNHNYTGGMEGQDSQGNQINLDPNYIGGYQGTYMNKDLNCQHNYTHGYDCN